MTLSPGLARAGLTFLLFGTAAAFLPSQDTSALADVTCSKNAQYVLRLTRSLSSSTPEAPNPSTINHSSQITLATYVSQDSGTSFKAATTTNFAARTLTYTLSNTGTAGRFYIGPNSGANPADPGQTVSYSPGDTVYGTGIYANQAGMSGSVTVTFHAGQITLVDTKLLTSN